MYSAALYWPGNSWWHRLDPRSKIMCALAYCLLMVRITDARMVAGLLLLAGLGLFVSQVPLSVYLKNMRGFALLILLTMIFQAWSAWEPAPVLTDPYFQAVDLLALAEAVLLGSKILGIALAALLFSLTTSPAALIESSGKVLGPLQRIGLPVQDLQMVMYIAYRFLPLLIQEGQLIREAQLSRGIDFKSGPVGTRFYKRLALVIPLLNRALKGAEQLAESMEARGYESGKKRTSWPESRLRGADYLLILISVLALGGLSLL